MKIRSIGLKNVKCFKQEKFDISIPNTNDARSVCIFVGTNGSGKSSILKAIVATMTGIDQRYAGDMSKNSDIYFGEDALEVNPLKFQYIDTEGSIVFKDDRTGENISLDMLSDGFKSLFFIAIDIIRRLSLAETFKNEIFYMKEAIILIDEIDCHIHPKWQRKLLSSLRELFPNCQFIVTTHSPFILDGMPEYSIIKIGEK